MNLVPVFPTSLFLSVPLGIVLVVAALMRLRATGQQPASDPKIARLNWALAIAGFVMLALSLRLAIKQARFVRVGVQSMDGVDFQMLTLALALLVAAGILTVKWVIDGHDLKQSLLGVASFGILLAFFAEHLFFAAGSLDAELVRAAGWGVFIVALMAYVVLDKFYEWYHNQYAAVLHDARVEPLSCPAGAQCATVIAAHEAEDVPEDRTFVTNGAAPRQ
ncbi:MAG TPA: hypothetical protein VFZ48_05015 [Candidatus Saccharimonadales bacterium]